MQNTPNVSGYHYSMKYALHNLFGIQAIIGENLVTLPHGFKIGDTYITSRICGMA